MADHEREPFPSEADVDAVLAEFGGDSRATIRALLHDVAALAEDFRSEVSRGFVRGDVPPSVVLWRSRWGA